MNVCVYVCVSVCLRESTCVWVTGCLYQRLCLCVSVRVCALRALRSASPMVTDVTKKRWAGVQRDAEQRVA